MRYDEFRDQLQEALYQVRLAARNFSRPLETVDVASTERRWQVYLWQTGQPGAEPFQISARIAFDWSPVDSARAYTTEEDLLIDLVGKKEIPAKTENRWMRVDFVLQAALPYGSTTFARPAHFGFMDLRCRRENGPAVHRGPGAQG